MTTSELVFIPSPGAGLLPPMVEFAKHLLHRDQRLSITIILMNLPPLEAEPTPTPRLRLMDIPNVDKSAKHLHISPKTFVSDLIEHQKPHVRNIVRGITDVTASSIVQLLGFVVGMFSVDMTEVANEFGVPTYVYYTASAASLGLMFELQRKHDEENFDITQLKKDSELELSIPSYANPLPVRVLPSGQFDQDADGSNMFDGLARKYREAKGIIVNTFQELESHAVESLLDSNSNVHIPPIFPVGPILNTKGGEAPDYIIMTWLNEQPKSSVVFLCFGSMGSFNEEQVKEICIALELSGQRFLWSLRRPPPKEKVGGPRPPTEYENLKEVLSEGFLERTSNVGKVIGWAPQMAILSHPSIGGFVSHCGWNSILESIWCGVPMAAWPMYAEQKLNAFKLVVELGIAAEIKINYASNIMTPAPAGSSDKEMIVTAEEIQNGIRRLMSDCEMRKKVEEMKGKSRYAVCEDGSSHESVGRFIDYVIVN